MSRRIAEHVTTLRYVQQREGWSAALLTFGRRVLRFATYRLRALMARRDPNGGYPGATVPTDPQALARPPEAGVLFIGYVEASLGLGESQRGLIRAAAGTPVPFAIHPYNRNVETRRMGAFQEERYDRDNRFLINVMELAADQLPLLLSYLGEWRVKDSYNILRTYWELPEASAQWAVPLKAIDEIWAPNEFVAAAFRKIYEGPVSIVHPCVELDFAETVDRAEFSLEDGVFYFIFTFDYFSYPARKNPLGVVEAFRAAFPDRSQRVGLILKSTSAPDAYEDVKHAIGKIAEQDDRIVIIDSTLSRTELLSLIACSDCYISLHRSEGFGLAMVEAMLLGKPVIATDFSGSRDFLSEATGFPVDYALRPLQDGEYIFSEGQHWAEPNPASAVAAMRRVHADPEEARLRAARGKAFVETRYGRAAVGQEFEGRTREIFRHLRQPVPF